MLKLKASSSSTQLGVCPVKHSLTNILAGVVQLLPPEHWCDHSTHAGQAELLLANHIYNAGFTTCWTAIATPGCNTAMVPTTQLLRASCPQRPTLLRHTPHKA